MVRSIRVDPTTPFREAIDASGVTTELQFMRNDRRELVSTCSGHAGNAVFALKSRQKSRSARFPVTGKVAERDLLIKAWARGEPRRFRGYKRRAYVRL